MSRSFKPHFISITFIHIPFYKQIMGQLKRRKVREFKEGPETVPSATFLEWLKTIGRRVRIPVVVHFDDTFPRSVETAYVGTTKLPPKDAIHLAFDDTGMGIPLSDHFRDKFPEGDWCVIWIEGNWGSILPSILPPGAAPDEGDEEEGYPFSVFGVGDLIEVKEGEVLKAFVEK